MTTESVNYNMRQLHVLRILAGFILGLSGNFIHQMISGTTYLDIPSLKSAQYGCSPCEDPNKIRAKPCPYCGPQKMTMENDGNIIDAYKPKGMYEITRWYYFDEAYLYDIINDEPKVKLAGSYYEETQAVTQVALEYINANNMLGKKWHLVGIENGYMRTDVFRGTDYILDVAVKSVEKYESESIHTTFRVRMVHAFQEKGSSLKVTSQHVEPNIGIHIIAPVSGDDMALENFVKIFAEKRSTRDKLTLVLFNGKGHFGDQSITLKPKVDELINQFPNSMINVIEAEGDYNFLVGIKEAARGVDNNDIILTLNIDMHFGQDLLKTCKLISTPQKRVYFPIAFSQYDPEIIERGMPPGKPKNINKMDINKFTGYWMHKKHNFICAYKEDLTKIVDGVLVSIESAQTTDPSKEGGTDIYNSFLSDNVEVISAVEPDLIRIYRQRSCDRRFMVDEEYNYCFKTAAEMLGSKPTLSILYLTEIALKKV
uniref:chondroitin sulfate synthase 1-like n=1 Tax=Styela clava TaxID=7725 RepID=UPI00193A9080|nr:chondroitin sulfate synthase 1-like [Styela clava]